MQGQAHICWVLVGEVRSVTKEAYSLTGNCMLGVVCKLSKRCKVRSDMKEGITNSITEVLLAEPNASKEVITIWVEEFVASGTGGSGQLGWEEGETELATEKDMEGVVIEPVVQVATVVRS